VRFNDILIASLEGAGLAVPRIAESMKSLATEAGVSDRDATAFLKELVRSGDIVKATDEFYFAVREIKKLAQQLRLFADGTPDRMIDVAKFKELSGVSRKYAIPLLEYFDRVGVTRRAGEKRFITK
jgi:selenocysteine-specific elongation factor